MKPDDPTSEFDLVQLKLAFTYHVVQQILGADDRLARGEIRFIEQRFPRTLLEKSGFLGPDGAFTDQYRKATGEALTDLPDRLTLEEKLALVDVLLDATLADDELHVEEGRLLVHAAHLLGLNSDELDRHLSSRKTTVGDIELTTAEWER